MLVNEKKETSLSSLKIKLIWLHKKASRRRKKAWLRKVQSNIFWATTFLIQFFFVSFQVTVNVKRRFMSPMSLKIMSSFLRSHCPQNHSWQNIDNLLRHPWNSSDASLSVKHWWYNGKLIQVIFIFSFVFHKMQLGKNGFFMLGYIQTLSSFAKSIHFKLNFTYSAISKKLFVKLDFP